MTVQHRTTAVLTACAVIALPGCVTFTQPESPPAPPPARTADLAAEESSATPVPTQVPPQPASVDPEVPAAWTDTLQQVSTGVTSISIRTCDSSGGSGTGFLVGDDLIVTAAHVVAGAASVQVNPAGSVSEAELLGYSEEADLALLRIEEPVEGHILSWLEEPPKIGQEVAALGYPLGGGFTSVQGVVSSLNPRVQGFSDTARYIQTDAPTNPGNSGGPLVTLDGDVAGVVLGGIESTPEGRRIEGMNFAISAEDARPLVEGWAASARPLPLVECPVAPDVPVHAQDVSVDVTVASTHENAADLAQLLAVHGNAINDSQYDVAFDLFTPALQEQMGGLETWREGLLTTFWRELVVVGVTGSGDTLTARTLVRTEQSGADGPDGQTCSNWALDYTVVRNAESGRWLIDNVTTEEDPQAC